MSSLATDHQIPPLRISVMGGVGSAPTKLAAFDAALLAVGIENFNLIRLSSVIPPGSQIVVLDKPVQPVGEWGDRLYVVAADWRSDRPGDQAWAGIGWIQDRTGGHGLFVEHEGNSEEQVRRDISCSLEALRRGRGSVGRKLGPPQMVACGVTCIDEPVCAVVVAVFLAEPWHPDTRALTGI